MRIARLVPPLLFTAHLAGCDTTPIEDDLILTVEDGASVDVECTACERDALVHVRLEYVDRYRTNDELFELHQYRVDYRMDELDRELPFFAAESRLQLAPGQGEGLSLQVAGDSQRERVREASETEAVAGTALLTLAGIGPAGEHVFLEAELPIVFIRSEESGGDDASE